MESEKLRELASWYREFAERTANPAIWESRLRTADDLDAEADRLEAVARKREKLPIGGEERRTGQTSSWWSNLPARADNR